MICLTGGPAAGAETVGGAAGGASGLLPLQPMKPTRSGSPCLNKGCQIAKVTFRHTVKHFYIAALKNCDPKTMTLIATFKNCDPGSLRCLVLGYSHFNGCKFSENGPILTI